MRSLVREKQIQARSTSDSHVEHYKPISFDPIEWFKPGVNLHNWEYDSERRTILFMKIMFLLWIPLLHCKFK